MSNIATATAALENVSILPARLCPWHENPYGLISWWDMQNFAGDDLFSALAILSKIECGMLHYKAPGDSAIAHLMGPIVLPVEAAGDNRTVIAFYRIDIRVHRPYCHTRSYTRVSHHPH